MTTNRIITEEQLLKIRAVLEDAEGYMECNCGGPCEGTCTHALSIAAQALLDRLLVPALVAIAGAQDEARYCYGPFAHVDEIAEWADREGIAPSRVSFYEIQEAK